MAMFGKRDLGLALSEDMRDNIMSATFDDTATDVKDAAHKAKLDPTRKVQRLRPGALPGWVHQDEEEEGFTERLQEGRGRGGEKEEEGEEYVPTQTAHKEDRRLLRLEQARKVAQESRRGARRAVYEAEVITAEDEDEGRGDEEEEEEYVAGDMPVRGGRGGGTAEGEGEEEEDDDEDAIARRRAAIRERLKNLRMEEEAAAAARPEGSDEESEGDEDEEESEYETDTDESEEGGVGGLLSMPKPIFIPKHKRELVKEQEREEREEAEKERKKEIMLERRKRETRNLVAEEIRKDAEGSAENVDDGYGSEAGAPDDVDRPEDDALEFEKWRLRELFRIKRDRDARQARAKEKAEVERRRSMTDEQRAAEDARLGLNKPKEKASWKFMQKYYHKGAFYMDEDSVKDTSDVRLRAADAATGEDKFNKEALPQVMQVKNFGRAGQTKYTHLLDQDTTRKGMGSVWQQSELDRKQGVIGEVRNRWRHQLAGTGEIDKAGRKRPNKK